MKGFLPTSSGMVLLSLMLCLTIVVKGNGFENYSTSDRYTRLNLDLDQNGLVSVDAQAALDHIGESGSYTSLVSNPASFNCADVGDQVVVITATRSDGSSVNFNVGVTVRDLSPPVLVLNEFDLVLDADGMGSLNWWDVVDTICDGSGENCTKDNCSINYSLSKSEFTCSDLGVKSISVTATDAGGNEVTKAVNVTVIDNIPPLLVLKNGTVGLNRLGTYTLQEWRVVDSICDSEGNNCTKDACGYTITVSQTEFSCADLGLNVLTVTATDPSGNTASGTINLTIIDGQGPVAITKDITLSLGDDGMVELEPEMVDNGSYDACSAITLSVSKSIFNCADIGSNTVTLTATDDRGWGTSETATVTIVDNLAPVVVTQNIAVDLHPDYGYVDIDPKDLLVICPDAVIEEPPGPIDFFVPGEGNEESVGYRIIDFEDCTKDNCKITRLLVSKERFLTEDIGENTVSIYVYDETGNFTVGTAIVTVNDNIVPTAVSKDITIDLDINGIASITADDIDDGSSDNVSVILSIDKTDFTCSDIGDNIVTLTVQDPSGNTAVTTSTVTVRDIMSPVVTPKNISVALDAAGSIVISPNDLIESVQEGCVVSSVIASKTNFSCTDLGENVVSVTVTDSNGNQTVVGPTVTVVDETGPLLTGKDLEVSLDADGNVSITADQLYESVSDNCTLQSVTLSKSDFNCDDLGDNDVTVSAFDTEGNRTDITVKVTIIDDTPPLLITRSFTTGLNTLGRIEISAHNVVDLLCDASGENCSKDNCSVSYVLSRTHFDCTDIGTHTITITATDQAGNVSTSTSEVTVINGSRPQIRAKDVTIELGPDGLVELDPIQLDDGSSAICGGLEYGASKTMFNCADIGTQEVNLTITDERGYSETETVNVTIVDNAPPVVVTKNIEVSLDENNRVIIEPVDLLNLCPDVIIETGGGEDTDEFVPGIGSSGTYYESIIEVVDGCTRDNCEISSVSADKVLFTQDDIGDNEVTVVVFDKGGNLTTETAIVTVIDNIPPVVLKRNLLIDLLPDGQVSIDVDRVDAGSSDNVGIVSRTLSQYDFDCTDVGVNEVILTVADAAGNETVATSIITIRDQTAPVLNLKEISVALTSDGTARITAADVDDGSTDACGIAELSLDKTDFTCADIGNNTISVTATDANGNESQANVIVNVADPAPVINVRSITIDLDETRDGQGKASIEVGDVVESVIDYCGSANLSLSKKDFSCVDLGENEITITATDEQGNIGSAVAMVTVRDVTPPSIEMNNWGLVLDQEEITVPAQDFVQSFCVPGIPDSLQPCTHDNCSMTVTVSKDGENFIPLEGDFTITCSDVGTLTITVRAEDGSGNVTEESRDYTVNSTQKPVIVSKDYVAYLDASGSVTIAKEDVYESITSLCGISSISVNKLSFDCSNQGNNNVTITATDIFGNVETAAAIVNVRYDHPPVITPIDVTVDLDETRDGQAKVSILPSDVYRLENDECLTVDVSLSKDEFTCSDLGVNQVTITAVDGSGNEVSAIANVTVRDVTPPFIAFNLLGFNLSTSERAVPASDFIKSFCIAGRTNRDQPCTNDNCGLASVTVSKDGTNFVPLDGEILLTCEDVGGLFITVRAEDNSGNVTEETHEFSVGSTRKPDIVSKDTIVSLGVDGLITLDQDDVYESVTDNCGISSIVVSKLSFSCLDLGPNEVTITATDIHGNVQTATSMVTIVDDIGPSIQTVDVTIDLNDQGEASLDAEELYSSISDNCGNYQNVRLSKDLFTCSDVGLNEVLVMADDDHGNTSSVISQVTIRDVTDPIIQTKSINVTLDDSGKASIRGEDVDDNSTDICGIVGYILDKTEFTCANLGENTVTLTIADASGNSVSKTAVVNVVDEVAPVIETKDITVELDETGNVTVTASQLYEQITDNCNVASISASKLSFNCEDVGVSSVAITAIDESGNIQTEQSTVIVRDILAPAVVTRNVSITLDEYGEATLKAEEVNNGSNDACGIQSLSLDKTSFSCNDLGENTVTLTVVDINGNENQGTATITVLDEVLPVIESKEVGVELDATGNATITADVLYNDITDNCGILSIEASQLSFDCSDIGENMITLTATDHSGNEQTSQSKVTVSDVTAPAVITKNIEVRLNENGVVSISPEELNDGSTDACGLGDMRVDKREFGCDDLGENQVTLTITDVNGNQSQGVATVTVKDKVVPVLMPKDISVELGPSGEVTLVEGQLYESIHDNCEVASVVASKLSFDCSDIGEKEVVITVTDQSGNEVTAISKVTVIDKEVPVLVPRDFTVDLDETGSVTITESQLYIDVSDNCSISSIIASKLSFDCSDVGENIITLTVTDQSGNESSVQSKVILRDVTAPIIIARNIEVPLSDEGLASVSAEELNAGSTDACGIASMSVSKNEFNCSDLGENQVTLTIVDVSGNESESIVTVSVIDRVLPIIETNDIVVDLEANGNILITKDQLYNRVTDNCGIASITASQLSFDCANVGVNEVVITAIDNNGNEHTAVSEVTIRDVTAPVVVSKEIEAFIGADGEAFITVEELNGESFDPCGIGSMSIDKSVFTCEDLGQNEVTLTVVDINGNQSQAIEIVTVKDKIAPIIVAKDVTVELDDSGIAVIQESDLYDQITDNCAVASIVASKLTFDCADVGSNDVNLTVSDASGNVQSVISKVTIIDKTVPKVLTKNISVSLNDSGNVTITPQQVDNGSLDACGVSSLEIDKSTFSCEEIGENRVTLIVIDNHGNRNVGLVTVTVKDDTSPLVIPKDISVDLDRSGGVNIQPQQLYHEVNDNCQVEAVEASKVDFNCSDIGVNEITLTVTDKHGNQSEALARVTVNDGIAPVVNAKSARVILNNNGIGSLTIDQINDGSSDACGIKSMSLSKSSFDCNDIGDQIIELIVEDLHGNIARTTAIVTVVDEAGPELELRTAEVDLDQEGKGSLVLSEIIANQGDNCGITDIRLSKSEFNCQDVGEQVITVIATDNSGNSTEKNIAIKVNDKLGPEVKARSITVQLDRLGKVEVMPESLNDGSSDPCGIEGFELSQSVFDCSYLGENSVILTAKDIHGNRNTSAALITVVDKIAPEISVNELDLELDASGKVRVEASQLYSNVTDNCGVDVVVASKQDFDCGDIGRNVVVITARDKSGNQSTAQAIVNISDKTPPTVFTRPYVLRLDNLGKAILDPKDLDNGSTDNCGEVSLLLDKINFNCQDIGEYEVTITAVDTYGNESISREKVTIIDELGPAIVAKDIVIELNEEGVKEIDAASLYSSVTDNCSLASVSASKLKFDCSDIGVQLVTIEALDKAGNLSRAESRVTVGDNLMPTVKTKNIEVEINASGVATISADAIDDGSTDNCSALQYELSKTRFSCSDIGTNEVTLRVRDSDGNTSIGTAVVTVIDRQAPVIVPSDYVVDLDIEGIVRLNPDDMYSSITDNCEIKSIVVTPLAFTCADVGEKVVTITAVDVNDNVSQSEAKLTIRDTSSPVILTKDITVELDISGKAVIRPLDLDNGSRDNCGITLSLDKFEFDCGDVGVNNVVLTGIDSNGNQAIGVARVTVLGDNDIARAVNTLTLSPLDAVCENADIVITLENTVEGLIYSLIDNSGDLIGKGIGTNGDLRINLSEEAIDKQWRIDVSNENGCVVQSNITGRIVNAEPVEADFYRQGNDKILVDVPVQFFDRSVGSVVRWEYTTDGSAYDAQDPLITFRQQGVRSVKLLVESNQDCTSERIRNYTVEGEWMAEAPTAFSPNSTLPENRVFKVITRGLREEKLIIYDRSGRVVHNGENEWSGTITVGGDILPGPYLFEFHAETVNGVPIFKRGRFMLF